MNSKQGQSLAEYVLISVTLFAIVVPTLLLFGNHLSDLLQGLHQNLFANHKSTKATMFTVVSNTTNTSDNHSTPIINTVSSISDDTSENRPETVGANGNLNIIQAHLNDIQAIAEKYKISNPQLYNLLVQLQDASTSMKKMSFFEALQIQDVKRVEASLVHFENMWHTKIQGSPEFDKLSPEDQTQLTQLIEETYTAAQYFVR